jgi:ATP-dependent Clp protease ATP-binding subunit ClpA
MTFLNASARELARLSSRIGECCVVFDDHPLPVGVTPSRGRVGIERSGDHVSLLVDRGMRYAGTSESVSELVSTGRAGFATLTDLRGWLLAATGGSIDTTAPLHAEELCDYLTDRVIDQDEAMVSLSRSVVQHLRKPAPRSPLVVAAGGPTGVGKTFVGECCAEALGTLTETDWGVVRVDCNEFEAHHRVASLLGAPPGYVGSATEPDFLDQLRSHDASFVILDEWEKAHPDVVHALMGAFDSGRLRPANGDPPIDVRRCIFFLTTNLADQQFEAFERDNRSNSTSSIDEAYRRLLVAGGLPPPVVGRLDLVLPFRRLSPAAEAAMTIAQIRSVGAEYGFDVGYVAPEVAVRVLDRVPVHDQFGARTIRRMVEAELAALFAETRPVTDVVIEWSGAHAVITDARSGLSQSPVEVIPPAMGT